MPKYELTSDLLTGNSLIDSEHKTLLDAVNAMMEACGMGQGRDKVGSTAKFLLSYVNRHFSDEQNLQIKSKYPGYEAHKRFHESYKKQLAEVVKDIEKDETSIASLSKLNNVVGVLVSHIRTEDRRLAQYLSQNRTSDV